MTKLFACPGLRLGYVLADAPFITRVAGRQPRWSVNGLALAALPELLEGADLVGWAGAVGELRAELIDTLLAYGLRPLPSAANYVLVADAAGLRSRLAPHGVLVRDGASFGLADHVRIAVPSPAGLRRLRVALELVGPSPASAASSP
jgi:histidinol-phosphate/aromatic aminotransferase/cobyric acid decarboxylase-like protein